MKRRFEAGSAAASTLSYGAFVPKHRVLDPAATIDCTIVVCSIPSNRAGTNAAIPDARDCTLSAGHAPTLAALASRPYLAFSRLERAAWQQDRSPCSSRRRHFARSLRISVTLFESGSRPLRPTAIRFARQFGVSAACSMSSCRRPAAGILWLSIGRLAYNQVTTRPGESSLSFALSRTLACCLPLIGSPYRSWPSRTTMYIITKRTSSQPVGDRSFALEHISAGGRRRIVRIASPGGSWGA